MYVCMYVYFYSHYKLLQLVLQMKEGKCIFLQKGMENLPTLIWRRVVKKVGQSHLVFSAAVYWNVGTYHFLASSLYISEE